MLEVQGRSKSGNGIALDGQGVLFSEGQFKGRGGRKRIATSQTYLAD